MSTTWKISHSPHSEQIAGSGERSTRGDDSDLRQPVDEVIRPSVSGIARAEFIGAMPAVLKICDVERRSSFPQLGHDVLTQRKSAVIARLPDKTGWQLPRKIERRLRLPETPTRK